MSTELAGQQKDSLLGFLGYGNPKADVVFLGMEEGLIVDRSYPLDQQLIDRSKFPAIVDLHVATVRSDKFLTQARPPIQPTWNVLIRTLYAFRGVSQPSRDDVRDYQSHRLGVAGDETLLVELMPLPAPKLGSWPYRDYFSEFPNRPSYLKALLDRRKAALTQALSYGPQLVLAYGTTYWEHYRDIFRNVTDWHVRGDAFSLALSQDTAIVLMPHPASRKMNGQRTALFELARQLGSQK